MKNIIWAFIFITPNLYCQSLQPVVTIENGDVIGRFVKPNNLSTYMSFTGIPYAKAPLGRLRFKAPERYNEIWREPWNATFIRSDCIQLNNALKPIDEDFYAYYGIIGSEDCLYLNVYTPDLDPGKAVVVFLPGGAFTFGTTIITGPNFIMDKNVILVSISHRLGPLGFLSTGDHVVSGNSALRDQIAALQWVQRNIIAFGGDPNRVTISGLSSGAICAHFLVLSPAARGLFSQAILFSGSAFSPQGTFSDIPEKTQHLATAVGCPVRPNELMVECLQLVPVLDLIDATRYFKIFLFNPCVSFGPVIEVGVDDPIIGKNPNESVRDGSASDIPIMMGTVSQDGLYPTSEFTSNPLRLAVLNENWIDWAPKILLFDDEIPNVIHKSRTSRKIKALYLDNQPIGLSTVQPVIQIFTDFLFANPLLYAAIDQTHHQVSSFYAYKFNYVHSMSHSVPHGEDTLYVFNNLLKKNMVSQTDKQMRDVMVDLFTYFMKHSAPPPYLNWEPFSVGHMGSKVVYSYMNFDGPQNLGMVTDNHIGNIELNSECEMLE